MAEPDAPATLLGVAHDRWVDLVDAAHAKIAPRLHAGKTAQLTDMLETFEADVGPLIAPIAQRLLQNPDLPDEIRTLLGPLAAPEHFGESVVIGIAIGAILAPVLNAAIAPTVQTLANSAWSESVAGPVHGGTIPLSPDLLAAAVIKGVLTAAEAHPRAAESGTSASDFDVMAATAGQSIGIEEALLLWRRKQIDEAELERIIRYSNVRNDFIPDVKLLQYGTPSAGEVISGALKHHLDEPTARVKLAESGIDPANYPWMVATAGRPPGVEGVLELWNRGLVNEAQVDQVIAQSDINPDYAAIVKLLRIYFPPPRSIVPMLRSGAISEAEARTLLAQHGVQPNIIDAFVKEATTTKASSAKELSQAQVLRLLEANLITPAAAQARLALIGYPADQITLLIDFAEGSRLEKLTNALIAQIGTLYTAHKIDQPTATTALTGGNVPADAQTQLFRIWNLERAAKVHHPTVAQVVGAFRRQEITALETKTRLTELGVQGTDLGIVVADGWPPTQGATGRAAAQAVIDA